MGFRNVLLAFMIAITSSTSYANTSPKCSPEVYSNLIQKQYRLQAINEQIKEVNSKKKITNGAVIVSEVITLTGYDLTKYALGQLVGGTILDTTAFIKTGEVSVTTTLLDRIQGLSGATLILAGMIGQAVSKSYLIYLDQVQLKRFEQKIISEESKTQKILKECTL